jgi:hypothetical protein
LRSANSFGRKRMKKSPLNIYYYEGIKLSKRMLMLLCGKRLQGAIEKAV